MKKDRFNFPPGTEGTPHTKEVHVGDSVLWCDANGRDHNALVQCVHSQACINLVFLSGDKARTDSYGRQIEHATSCQHVSGAGVVHGYYWRFPEEERNAYVPPVER
jgi:plastocyanin